MKLLYEQLLWLSFGVTLGIISALQLVAVLHAESSADLLKDYQTLIGVLFATVIALLTLIGTILSAREQINNSRNIEADRKAERLVSARALLPFALADLMHHAIENTRNLYEILPDDADDFDSNALKAEFSKRPPPRDAFIIMAAVIELAPVSESSQLAEILRRTQWCDARLENVIQDSKLRFSEKITPHDVRQRIVDYVDLAARLARCFDYARFYSDSITRGALDIREMKGAAVMSRIFLEDEPQLEQLFFHHLAYDKAENSV